RATSPTLAVAVIAGLLNDLPATFAARTGLLNAEKSLADAHAPLPVAGFAGDRARAFCRSAAAANLALSERLEVDIDAIAEDSLIEIELQAVAQVRTAKHLRAAAPAAAEDIAEHIAKDVAERVGRTESRTTAGRLQAGVSELVVRRALLRIGEDLVSLLGFLEFFFGFRVVGVAVGMKLHREPPVRLLDLGFGGVARQLEHFVVVAFRHYAAGPSNMRPPRDPYGSAAAIHPKNRTNSYELLRPLSFTSSTSASSTSSLPPALLAPPELPADAPGSAPGAPSPPCCA